MLCVCQLNLGTACGKILYGRVPLRTRPTVACSAYKRSTSQLFLSSYQNNFCQEDPIKTRYFANSFTQAIKLSALHWRQAISMWQLANRRRRAVSPSYYNNYDLDYYRSYAAVDALTPAYGYSNLGLPYGSLGLGDYITPTTGVEQATRLHASAQVDLEKAKEKYEEAKKKMEECEKKLKQADEVLRVAKCTALYAS